MPAVKPGGYSRLVTLAEMQQKISTGDISSVELIVRTIQRIDKHNPSMNAFIETFFEKALAEARLAEQRILQKNARPLEGIPLTIKDSLDIAGSPTHCGSLLNRELRPAHDATSVSLLREAGAIIVGKTSCPEFLMNYETDNRIIGRTNNPWDEGRTAGGSSGGEAAAIAAGLSAGGVGSDGGGSIRVPAHFCGICGLKPTPGRIPSTGHFPKSGGPFALLGVVGPMARTVADLRLLFRVMEGWDDGDPCAAPVQVRELHEKETFGMGVGFFTEDGRTPVTAETRAAVERAAGTLLNEGFRVEPFRPDGLDEARELWWKLFGIAGGMILGPMVRGREAELSPILREFISWTPAGNPEESAHTGESLLSTWLRRDGLREHILRQMRKYPVLICPPAAIPAFRHGEREWQVEGKSVKYLDAWSYCEWFNLLGFPAAVVPAGYSEDGLPIGVQ
ncbi:MAG: amidase, partial [Bryobacteraceae bacterium]